MHTERKAEKSQLARYLEEKHFFKRLFNETRSRAVLKTDHVADILAARSENMSQIENEETLEFLRQRDEWDDSAHGGGQGDNMCLNCAINASCYNTSRNLWHPSKCSHLKNYTAENVYLSEKCFNISMIVIGDSRGRHFFLGVVRRFYTDWSIVHR